MKPAGAADFILELPPLNELSKSVQEQLLHRLDSLYLNAGNASELLLTEPEALYVVYSGSFNVFNARGEVKQRLESGDFFGAPAGLPLLPEQPNYCPLSVHQDGIVYRIHADALSVLVDDPDVQQKLATVNSAAKGIRLNLTADEDWTQQPICDILQRDMIAIEQTQSIRVAAQLMAESGVSCLPVLAAGRLRGVLTDRDLRSRVLAAGVDPQQPIAEVMTPEPVTLQSTQPLFEAMALMSQHNVHHLPVVDEQGAPVGVITASDVLRQQRNTPYLFSQSLHKAPNLEVLVTLAQELPQHIRAFAQSARDAATAGRLVAAVTDTLTQRLIVLYSREHTPPQVPWAWLAFGSQGRCDQTLYSDQDNGLLLDDHITDTDRQWFEGLARWVCDGLAACGIPYCPGDIMASNPKWRLTQSEWEARFREWIDAPTPKGVMHSMIFFDSRCVAGHQALYNRFRKKIAQLGQQSQFLAQMGGIVVRIPVPLGLFDRFRTQRKDGEDSIDIKTLGIAVANDLVRLQALHAGLTEAPTLGRLQALSGRKGQAQEDLDNLAEAWRVLTDIRLQWQLSEVARVSAPNQIQPDRLSTLQRRQLKAAFRILKRSQEAVALRYRLGI